MALSDVIVALAGGMALGLLHLSTLWLIVRRLPAARRPSLLLLAGAAARMAVLLAGIYWLSGGRWQGLLAGLAGFLLVRLVFTAWAKAGATRPAARPLDGV